MDPRCCAPPALSLAENCAIMRTPIFTLRPTASWAPSHAVARLPLVSLINIFQSVYNAGYAILPIQPQHPTLPNRFLFSIRHDVVRWRHPPYSSDSRGPRSSNQAWKLHQLHQVAKVLLRSRRFGGRSVSACGSTTPPPASSVATSPRSLLAILIR